MVGDAITFGRVPRKEYRRREGDLLVIPFGADKVLPDPEPMTIRSYCATAVGTFYVLVVLVDDVEAGLVLAMALDEPFLLLPPIACMGCTLFPLSCQW